MLALTMGDPAGIGGELTTQMLDNPGIPFVVLDDPARLAALGVAKIVEVGSVREARSIFPRAIPVLPVFLQVPARPGQPDPTNAPAIIESITRATRLALSGEVGGIVTNPISKSTLYQAGFGYPGHTEFLAALTAAPTAIMMLVAPALRVVPVTVHVALRDVINTLTTQAILQAARITAIALRQDFNIADPRLAIAGLNPHAGESGGLGDEENTLITPAIDQLRREGWNVSGPWPADTMFTPQARAGYDVAICMYHDQALIPLKTLDRDNGVNVTLGLPIIRTSPDHGTAFDIAGKGHADPSSLRAAMRLAAQMAEARATSPVND